MSIVRLARMVAIAVLVGVAVSHVRWMIFDWNLHDMNVYWDAAMRLRHGQELYAAVDPVDVYRYAPWFAYAWVPLTYLPKPMVDVGWSAILVIASGIAVWPLIRERTRSSLLVALLLAPLLFAISSVGNVQPLMMLALLYGIPRASGPVWIALSASLKVVPIVFVLVYVSRREWSKVAWSLVLTAGLGAPALLYHIPPEVLSPGAAQTLPFAGFVVVAAAALVVATVIAWRSQRWAPLAAATASVLVLPRLFLYEVSMLLVGTLPVRSTSEVAAKDARSGPELIARPQEQHL
jgi:hypothetical protein